MSPLDGILAIGYGVAVAIVRLRVQQRDTRRGVDVASVFVWFALFGRGDPSRAAGTLFLAAAAVWVAGRLITASATPAPAAGRALSVPMIASVVLLILGSCTVAQSGLGVDRPGSSLDALAAVGVGLCLLAVAVGYRAFRTATRRALLGPAMVALTLGPSGVFYLTYNGLPPFQISDGTSVQYAIHRRVPGKVSYTTGYSVTVAAPSVTSAGAATGSRVWIIPVRFSNDRRDDSAHIGRCSLYVDGVYRDAHRERPDVRGLGDVDGKVVSFSVGAGLDGRVAFDVAERARDVILECQAKGYVPTLFDLRPFAVAR